MLGGGAYLWLVSRTAWFVGLVALALGSVFAGRLLGERVWPSLGAWISRVVLRGYAHWGHHRGARLVITPCADFVPGRLRQTWEAMAFACALGVLVGATLLFVTHGSRGALPLLSFVGLVLCGVLTFVIVPHWVFARLGLRLWLPRRFLLRSLSESYASFVRVSNGTLLVVAAFYGVNVLATEGTRTEGYLTVLLTMAGLLVLSIAVFGTAAAYFKRHEDRLLQHVAAEARRLGFATLRHGTVPAP